MTNREELLKIFVVESEEGLTDMEQALISLETKDGDVDEYVARIFRAVHTIKGNCGVFGLTQLAAFTHGLEDLLDKLREHQVEIRTELITLLLNSADCLRELVSRAAENPETMLSERENELLGEIRLAAGTGSSRNVESVILGRPSLEGAMEAERTLSQPASERVSVHKADSTIRVDVSQLDTLMNQVGELVLVRNEVLQFAESHLDTRLASTVQRLNHVTIELQEGIMKTRMQPISRIFNTFPRFVRELALELGKKVRVDIEGEGTELDRSLIEAIHDPLTHLVRNAVDHGIESPEVRVRKEKSEEGCILARAYHEGGQVNIDISDDGAGIDLSRITRKIVDANLARDDAVASMSEREIMNHIFLPGFSTADKVSSISGRGVGMDVVRTNIERIGGTIEAHSLPGNGATFKIRIPLTLAIIPALIIGDDGVRYAIPQVSLVELVRLEEASGGWKLIEEVYGVPVYRLRGDLLPLVRLRDVLRPDESQTQSRSGDVNVIVLDAEGNRYGLVVDTVHDTEEIVVKPLGHELRGLSCYAGATILGDGRISLILDVVGIARSAHAFSEGDRLASESGEVSGEELLARDSILLMKLGTGRVATRLSNVSRLEEFEISRVERVGSRNFVQYRDSILPLIHFSRLLQERRKAERAVPADRRQSGPTEVFKEPEAGSLQVIVFEDRGALVGFVVDSIIDIVEETLRVQHGATRPGVVGTAVVEGRITEVLDVAAVIGAATTAHRDSAEAGV